MLYFLLPLSDDVDADATLMPLRDAAAYAIIFSDGRHYCRRAPCLICRRVYFQPCHAAAPLPHYATSLYMLIY